MPRRRHVSVARVSFLTLALGALACGGGSDSTSSPDDTSSDGGSGGATGAGTGGTKSSSAGGSGGAHAGSAGSVASGGKSAGAGAGGSASAGKGGSASGGKGGTTGAGGAGPGPGAGGHAGGTAAGGKPGTGGTSSAGGSTGTGGTPFGQGGQSSAGGDPTGGGGDPTGGGGDPTGGGGDPTGGGGASTGPHTDYAPYFYTWGWDGGYGFQNLADLQKKTGITGITIAFVLSDGGCKATTDTQDHQSDVDAFRAAGSHVKASFGGADGKYIENGCGDADSLASAIEAFIDETGIVDLDFDVEQDGAMNQTVNTRRAQALAKVQQDKGAKIAFTLAVDPSGLPGKGMDVLTSCLDAGVTISHVNIMTMDYGSLGGQTLGQVAISSANGAHDQLMGAISGISDQDAWQMIGITPMIGVNDDNTTFTLDDAQSVADFASQHNVGLLAFWAIDRDQPGSGDLDHFSGANKKSFDFHKIFQAVAK